MSKSSINFQKASAHSYNHNFRKNQPNYLLPKKYWKKNEYWENDLTARAIFDKEFEKAKRKGGRVPKFENSHWEAVLNLNENHNIEDVKEVAEYIEKKFNIICSTIAIHRDEGYINNAEAVYNYHAHLNFVTYKDSKQNWRRVHIKPQQLSELQTEVAKILKMEPGKKNSKAVRLEHREYKALKKIEEERIRKEELAKERIKQEELVKQEEIKQQELAKEERIKQEEIEKKELENQNTTLKSKIENLENQNKELQINSNNWINFSNLKAKYEINLPDELEPNSDIENDFNIILKSINNSQDNITKLSENTLNNSESGWVKFSKLTSFVTSMYNKFKSIIAQKDETIAEQKETIENQNKTIAVQEATIRNDKAIFDIYDNTSKEQEKTIKEQEKTIAVQEATIRNDKAIFDSYDNTSKETAQNSKTAQNNTNTSKNSFK